MYINFDIYNPCKSLLFNAAPNHQKREGGGGEWGLAGGGRGEEFGILYHYDACEFFFIGSETRKGKWEGLGIGSIIRFYFLFFDGGIFYVCVSDGRAGAGAGLAWWFGLVVWWRSGGGKKQMLTSDDVLLHVDIMKNLRAARRKRAPWKGFQISLT